MNMAQRRWTVLFKLKAGTMSVFPGPFLSFGLQPAAGDQADKKPEGGNP